MQTVAITCSNKTRAPTQRSGKGHQWWKRDVFHVQKSGTSTMCGVDCSEWLRMDPKDKAEVIGNADCCARCAAILQGF